MELLAKYKERYGAVMHGPAAANTVNDLLAEFGVVDELYRCWLIETGGGPIGGDWYDNVDELRSSQVKRDEDGWTLPGFVIGWDGAGNPIALQRDGSIKVEDHNFGGIHLVAESFEQLLARGVS